MIRFLATHRTKNQTTQKILFRNSRASSRLQRRQCQGVQPCLFVSLESDTSALASVAAPSIFDESRDENGRACNRGGLRINGNCAIHGIGGLLTIFRLRGSNQDSVCADLRGLPFYFRKSLVSGTLAGASVRTSHNPNFLEFIRSRRVNFYVVSNDGGTRVAGDYVRAGRSATGEN